MVPERWALVGRTPDGFRCHVARETRDFTTRLTIWVLECRGNTWYSIGQWISIGKYREFDKPQKLSDSIIDQKLLSYALDS